MTEIPTKSVNENGSIKYTDSAGKLHREDGPAVEYADGDKAWFLHGKLHREDGPACEYADGSKFWYLHGEHHREDGPAYEAANGTKHWYLHGKLHKEDGPAIMWADGTKNWYLHGIEVDEKTYKHVLSCFLEELPEYIGTDYECLVQKRLER